MSEQINAKLLFNVPYGLYVLATSEGTNSNAQKAACIINTFAQVTDTPLQVSIAVNNSSRTAELIKQTGKFAVSILSTKASFDMFKHFGFASSRDTDKFTNYDKLSYADDGLPYLNDCANAAVFCEVVSSNDLGTHTVFFAKVTATKELSKDPSMTYMYYQSQVKPKPASASSLEVSSKTASKSTKYVCTICNYVYECAEGEEIPEDFICPWCKHGADAFEKVE